MSAKSLLRRVALGSARRAYEAMTWANLRASAVERRAFYSADDFPWVTAVERQWRVAQHELQQVLHRHTIPSFQDALPGQNALTAGDDWKSFFLLLLGHPIESNCRLCPQTRELLRQIPGVETAFFSILKPGKHIPPHRGPYNGVLRFHLGLIVPEPRERCRIRVGDQWAHWEEGASLIFDDTLEHEVFNDTDGRRVVLFVDFRRPLRFPMSRLNALVLRSLGRSGVSARRRKILAELTRTKNSGG